MAVKKLIIVAVLLFVARLSAQQLQDAPVPKSHGYMGTPFTRISFTASAAARSLDASITCHDMAHGAREVFAPVSTCSGISGFSAGLAAAGYGGQALFHTLGWHKYESIPHWVNVGFALSGVAYTLSHRVNTTPRFHCPATGCFFH